MVEKKINVAGKTFQIQGIFSLNIKFLPSIPDLTFCKGHGLFAINLIFSAPENYFSLDHFPRKVGYVDIVHKMYQ